MSDWWSYRLADFLMFSPRTYARLFELYNRDIWPLHIAALAMGIAILVLAARRQHPRIIALLLAIAWLWVAWAFFWERYSTIHTFAKWFAVAFVVEAILWTAAASPPLFKAAALPPHSKIFAIILFLYPLIGPRHELFAITPDPTALATIAIARRWFLLPIPILWCAMSAATHLAMATR